MTQGTQRSDNLHTTVNEIYKAVQFLVEHAGGVDNRLDGIDNRLDGIDNRLDGIDIKLDRVDERLDSLEGSVGELRERMTSVEKIQSDILDELRPLSRAQSADSMTIIQHDKRITHIEHELTQKI